MKKIVFLDIDGTLVTPNYPLSALVKKGIKKARENGHFFMYRKKSCRYRKYYVR